MLPVHHASGKALSMVLELFGGQCPWCEDAVIAVSWM